MTTSSSPSAPAGSSVRRAPSRRRMFSVELLRLLAIGGIAVFHAFLPTYGQIVALGPQAAAMASRSGALIPALAVLASTRPLVWAVAVLELLGAWGNHVFFMISGFFLVPKAAERSREPHYWAGQLRSTAHRILKVVAAVVFYAVIFMAVNRWIMPVSDAGTMWWVTYNLEFIWLYMFFIALAPVIGWVAGRCRKRWQAGLVGIALVELYVLNAYVALGARGDFGQLSAMNWRKQIGAVSYLASFIIAGVLGSVIRRSRRNVAAGEVSGKTSKREPAWLTRRFWLAVIVGVAVLAMVLSAVFVARDDYGLLSALSFKSTSVISFLLALSSLMIAVCGGRVRKGTNDEGVSLPRNGNVRSAAEMQTAGSAAAPPAGKTKAALEALASGILGFYIAQALGYSIMEIVQTYFTAIPLKHVAAAALAGSVLHSAFWEVAWFLTAIVVALALVVIICLFDRFVRQPLLRLVNLA
ncbi:hypothetical protein [Bifidobacterium sp. ESL0800]|uniref:hypothetical protein n=1 Tax=Bifidobacterium sp. ESL0800 TaxID=2983236 RepID=UPI0023FA35BA|nr:hypothetical protein [Bifidobacterium sp. ESL0800]WEV75130.1 hypothetical protein OZX75_05635 [Bifidobacterium sp. ESL0800]